MGQRIKYRLHNRLGAVKIPIQKTRFPRVFFSFKYLVRVSCTSYAQHPGDDVSEPGNVILSRQVNCCVGTMHLPAIGTSGGPTDTL